MASGHQEGPGMLREIEGMRAVAVLAVLLYHAHFGFSGGYVGVDVFFVLSGFLITGVLQRDRDANGHVSFPEFYARRARRLLPAATLVLVATIVLTNRLLSPVRAHQTAVDAGYAAGFVANFHFAADGADYLRAGLPPSLLQHWWSLAVEEQFYVVWPALLAVTWWLSKRIARSGLIVSAVVAVASFAVGLRLTRHNPAWGYFATWSRGWELALGAVCTFVWPLRHRLARRAVAGWLGLAVVAYGALRFDATTAFPGTAALVPVLGTVLVILSIGAARSPGRMLSVAPLQWIGGRSYAIYLWHWPLLMIVRERIESPGVAWRIGALLVSVLLAEASYRLLENPVRHMPALTRSAGRSLAMGGVLVALVVGGAVLASTATADISFSTGYVAPTFPATTAAPTSTAGAAVTGTTPPQVTTTTAPPDWNAQLTAKVHDELQPLIAASATQSLLPDNLTPRISDQADDDGRLYGEGCVVAYHDIVSPPCVYGDPNGTTVIALYGDSHAGQWFAGLERAALANRWKLLVVAKAACAPADIWSRIDATRPYPECPRWRDGAFQRLLGSDADLVIFGEYSRRYNNRPSGAHISSSEWRDALARPAGQLIAAGKQVLFLTDSPIPRRFLDQCLASHPRSVTACNLDRARSVDTEENALEQALAASLGAAYYDSSDLFCAGNVCPAVIGNMAVYLDDDHINNTYSASLGPYMALLVKATLQLSP